MRANRMPSRAQMPIAARTAACCLSFCLVLITPAWGQAQGNTGNAQAGITTLKVQANLVVLDVVVTDARGNAVPDLERKDFTVMQDGVVSNILSFDSWTARPPLPDKPVLDRFGRPDWGQAPLNIFVLDELNTPFDEIGYAASTLKKFLLAQPRLLASPAMLVVVTDFGYQTLTEYTRDRDRILGSLANRPPAIPAQFTRAASNDQLTAQTFALLQQIALSSAGMGQHKNVVWIGRGFPNLDPASLTPTSQASLARAIRSTVTLLLNARVTVYKIDPMQFATSTTQTDVAASIDVGGGTVDAPNLGEDPAANNFNFNVFALQTGGKYFYGLNDLDRYVGNSIDQGGRFYTLSYRPPPLPPNTRDGAYLNIKVSIDRPGLTAQTRQGYYASTKPDPPLSAKELGFALGQAATGGMVYTGVGVHVSGVAPAKDAGRASITFTIENHTLQWTPRLAADPESGSVAGLTAVLVGLNARREVISSDAYVVQPYLQARDADRIVSGEMTLRDDVSISSKTVSLRVIVRDSSGRIGTADVPAADVQRVLDAAQKSRGKR